MRKFVAFAVDAVSFNHLLVLFPGISILDWIKGSDTVS
ncbi:hypothetical protein SAMN05518872_105170 [Psychrobacillus sp. OK032]|nr:hypothetical protein SAMN05518872_105170 [Psychrobacillus sp. OK032]